MSQKNKSYQINFPGGVVSDIDENVFHLIRGLQKKAEVRNGLPYFYDLSQSLSHCDADLLKFYSYVLENGRISRSQLFQDLFVLFVLKEKRGGAFLEFGATDGVSLSNSFLLESAFGWRGVLAEPSPQWHEQLTSNRTGATILTECIYSESGEVLDFFVSESGVLSTLEEFRHSDIASMPENTNARNRKGYTHKVSTVSLNDVFLKHFGDLPVDYMSVDTEGSEFLILENFDFDRFAPKIVTVEHNFTETQGKLDELFAANGYARHFREHTQFDAWYVRQD